VPEGKGVLRQAFRRLEREVPVRGARVIRSLRHPDARWVRIPVGALCIVGGVLSFLPVLGIWMLPLGLLLIACDVPFLRKPVGYFTIWAVRKWTALRQCTARPHEDGPQPKTARSSASNASRRSAAAEGSI
jgi:hypothetical protein